MVKKRATGYMVQDLGLVLFLLCIGAMALAVGNAGEALLLEFAIMLLATFFAILLAGFKLNSLAIVASGFAIMTYVAYKVYRSFAFSDEIAPLCYVWIVLPVFSVAAMLLFIYGSRQTELENDVLKEQVEELVMINSLTGLYNLRSMYNDLQRQIAYAERNGMNVCLMIVRLRYEQELHSVLSRSHYEALIQKLAQLVVDTVRVEDRTYSLDNKGTVGVLLTCDQDGSESAKRRLKSALESQDSFAGITDASILVEVQIASLQYDKEKFGNDMITYKQKVESELQYDV